MSFYMLSMIFLDKQLYIYSLSYCLCLERSGTVIIFGLSIWWFYASAHSVLLLITMPRPRRSNLSQRSRNAIRQRNIASQLSDEEREIAREERRVSME